MGLPQRSPQVLTLSQNRDELVVEPTEVLERAARTLRYYASNRSIKSAEELEGLAAALAAAQPDIKRGSDD